MRDNAAFLKARLARYPWTVPVVKGGANDRRPEAYDRAHPGLRFCRVPIETRAVWMFETRDDLNVFRQEVGLGALP